MPENHLYEYAIVRVLPVVEREEFINVGIVLFCKRQKYISMLYRLDENRLMALARECDVEQLKLNLKAFEKIAHGDVTAGAIALMDVPSRFRWLTAVRSSMIQTSRPHPGLSHNLEATAKRLFEELVL